MSTEASKPSFDEVITEGTADFCQWLYDEAKNYWGIEISLADANELDDEEKVAVFTWVQEAIYADECFAEEFPEFDSTFDSLITTETGVDASTEAVLEEAKQAGVDAASLVATAFRDNPHRDVFAQESYIAWRTAFVQTRDGACEEFINHSNQEPEVEEPKPVEPAEPSITLLQRRMLEIDAELIDLNPRVRSART